MLRKLPRQGARVRPSNSRVRRRRTRHSREGGTTPPSTRKRRTLRILRRNVSRYSGIAPPTCGNAARDFRFDARINIKEKGLGAKCNHEDRQRYARVGYSLAATVLCEQVRRLNRFARGRLGTKGRVPEQVRHTTFGTVPPRYCLTLPLFLHTSAGKNPARSVPGSKEAVLRPAGADIVSLVHSFAVPQTAKDCAGAPASAK